MFPFLFRHISTTKELLLVVERPEVVEELATTFLSKISKNKNINNQTSRVGTAM
jgi:hypothetical protein